MLFQCSWCHSRAALLSARVPCLFVIRVARTLCGAQSSRRLVHCLFRSLLNDKSALRNAECSRFFVQCSCSLVQCALHIAQ